MKKAFCMQLRPGRAAEYIKAHNPIPDELALVLKRHGISDYHIYHDGRDALFAVMEIADPALLERLADYECCRKWWQKMCKYLVAESPNAGKAIENELTEVFFLQ